MPAPILPSHRPAAASVRRSADHAVRDIWHGEGQLLWPVPPDLVVCLNRRCGWLYSGPDIAAAGGTHTRATAHPTVYRAVPADTPAPGGMSARPEAA
jgi:hypothetical protein